MSNDIEVVEKHLSHWGQYLEASRRDNTDTSCSRETHEATQAVLAKAKAWDALYVWLDGYFPEMLTSSEVQAEMDKLLPPSPRTPLEKLEAWVNNERWYSRPSDTIPICDLAKEIARLKEEEGK